MAKGLRSKRQKKLRSLKRQTLGLPVEEAQQVTVLRNLEKVLEEAQNAKATKPESLPPVPSPKKDATEMSDGEEDISAESRRRRRHRRKGPGVMKGKGKRKHRRH